MFSLYIGAETENTGVDFAAASGLNGFFNFREISSEFNEQIAKYSVKGHALWTAREWFGCRTIASTYHRADQRCFSNSSVTCHYRVLPWTSQHAF